MLVIIRLLIGSLLLASGIQKAISPYQNFLYVIQGYQMLPSQLEMATAIILPWIELIVGLFMVLGLWLPWALKATGLLFAMFIVVVGQALLRGLPLDQCGCFGENIHISPPMILVVDSAVLLLTYVLTRNIIKTSRFSLDKKFQQ